MTTSFDRRAVLAGVAAASVGTLAARSAQAAAPPAIAPQWGIFEVALNGPRGGNPFRDVSLSAVFQQGARRVEVPGFYDGEGVYKLRFMPDAIGDWRYVTR